MRKKQLPSPKTIKSAIAIDADSLQFIKRSRRELTAILNGDDPRTILIVGPCSIHDITSAKEYALKLKTFSESVSDTFFILMRVYFAKPRTTTGWKGILYDPHLDTSHDVEMGIKWTRQLLVYLAEMGIATATEILDPLTTHYFSDLITWGCIGARTTESQIHREIASALPMPIAFKNNTNGNAQIAVDGAYSASTPHTYIGIDDNGELSAIETDGNPHCHIVLRGGIDHTNYDPQSISDAIYMLDKAGLNKKIIIDCSHDNAKKSHDEQVIVFESTLHQIIEGNKNIAGVILESHLNSGRQNIASKEKESLEYGKSITDPCLDWETTKNLILWGYDRIKKEHNIHDKELITPPHAPFYLSN